MNESMAAGGSAGAHTGEDFVCRNCGCEVMVKHWGQPSSHLDTGAFVCHCGQEMEPEHKDWVAHARAASAGGDGDGGFDQDDFLGQGGGAGEATGMGRTASSNSSPGGGL